MPSCRSPLEPDGLGQHSGTPGCNKVSPPADQAWRRCRSRLQGPLRTFNTSSNATPTTDSIAPGDGAMSKSSPGSSSSASGVVGGGGFGRRGRFGSRGRVQLKSRSQRTSVEVGETSGVVDVADGSAEVETFVVELGVGGVVASEPHAASVTRIAIATLPRVACALPFCVGISATGFSVPRRQVQYQRSNQMDTRAFRPISSDFSH